ncbi:hypothetical protein ABPG75_005794 [Micractinium tetrahymenae]
MERPSNGSWSRGRHDRSGSRARRRARSRSRSRSGGRARSREKRGKGPARQGPSSGHRGRSRSRRWGRRSSPGGNPEEPLLAPVVLQHNGGEREWLLCGREPTVSGLPPGVPSDTERQLRNLVESAGSTVMSCSVRRADHRGDLAYVTTPSARQTAMQGTFIDHRRLFLRPEKAEVTRQRQQHPMESRDAERLLASCQAGKPPPPHPRGGHGQAHQHLSSRVQQRGATSAAEPAVPAEPLLAPVLLVHRGGERQWQLPGSKLFVSRLPAGASARLVRELCQLAEGAGGTVDDCQLVKDRVGGRGDAAYMFMRTARQAAAFHGRSLFLRPQRKQVEKLGTLYPEEAAGAERQLAACAAGWS